MSQLVYSPLLDRGDDLEVRPALALRLDNPDPLHYIAYLRHGVTFHDGHELTSRDVVYTFKSILDPALLSPLKGAFRALKDVTAPDDHTVVFTLSEPFAVVPTSADRRSLDRACGCRRLPSTISHRNRPLPVRAL